MDYEAEKKLIDGVAGEELVPLLFELARRRGVRLIDIHEEESAAIRLCITETAENALQAFRVMARVAAVALGQVGRAERRADREVIVMATAAGLRTAYAVLRQHARDAVRRAAQLPRGVSARPRAQAAAHKPAWEEPGEKRTPAFGHNKVEQDAFAEALDRATRHSDRP
jgi:hypothetical protein